MKKSDIRNSGEPPAESGALQAEATLTLTPAPPDLAAFVSGFVHRDDLLGGEVVVELPEVRPSIQIMLGDPYWLRGQDRSSSWRRVPRIALWGPRHTWGYGFAARRIKVFAVGLTPAGARALTNLAMPLLVNGVHSLKTFDPPLAQDLTPLREEGFGAWLARATASLGRVFLNSKPVGCDLDMSVRFLATASGGGVQQAAGLAGMSERQFRRVFQDAYGASPKQYQRLLRLDRLLRQLHPAPWEADPLENEDIPFADQPHAIREFRALTGLTPARYVRSKKTHGDRVLRSVAAVGIEPPPRGGNTLP